MRPSESVVSSRSVSGSALLVATVRRSAAGDPLCRTRAVTVWWIGSGSSAEFVWLSAIWIDSMMISSGSPTAWSIVWMLAEVLDGSSGDRMDLEHRAYSSRPSLLVSFFRARSAMT